MLLDVTDFFYILHTYRDPKGKFYSRETKTLRDIGAQSTFFFVVRDMPQSRIVLKIVRILKRKYKITFSLY